jgi:hypothetical protein
MSTKDGKGTPYKPTPKQLKASIDETERLAGKKR